MENNEPSIEHTKTIMVLVGDCLRKNSVTNDEKNIITQGKNDTNKPYIILNSEGSTYIGRHEIGNGNDKKLSRKHLQFYIQKGVIYQHVTVQCHGINVSVIEKKLNKENSENNKNFGITEMITMNRGEIYSILPGDTIWLSKSYNYSLTLEEKIVPIDFQIEENNLSTLTNQSSPEYINKKPAIRRSVSFSPSVLNEQKKVFFRNIKKDIIEETETEAENISTYSEDERIKSLGRNNIFQKKYFKQQSPQKKNIMKIETIIPKNENLSIENDKKKNNSKDYELQEKYMEDVIQQAKQEILYVEELKKQLQLVSETVQNFIERKNNAINFNHNDKKIIIDYDNFQIIYQKNLDINNIDNKILEKSNSLSTPQNFMKKSASGTKSLTNEQLSRIYERANKRSNSVVRFTRLNKQSVLSISSPNIFSFDQQVKTSSFLHNASPLNENNSYFIPIFPGIHLQIQNIVEFSVSNKVKKQLEKYKEINKFKGATISGSKKK